ncbi:hypothetical protein [Rhizobium etli]|uniref:hypothetical protein n=1 Tax=Rhizobium etli TaxID=29449 RepID=UPI001FD15BC5|nr:hypothetical protein [Rhizobium etli]
MISHMRHLASALATVIAPDFEPGRNLVRPAKFAKRGEFHVHLIQLFIPAAPRAAIDIEDIIAAIQREMTERHGGVTAYLNSPAKGLWSNDEGTEEDTVIVIEVMVGSLDRVWWRQYLRELEQLLGQDELLVRALPVETL